MLRSFIGRTLHIADTGGGTGGDQQQNNAAGQGDQQQGGEGGDQQEQAPVTWDSFYGALPVETQEMIDSHIGGLKSALGKERDRAQKLEKDVSKLAAKADDPTTKAQLEQLATDLAAARIEGAFYREAVTESVAPDALELAFLAAKSGGFIADDGEINWKTLKTAYPRLFGAVTQEQVKTKVNTRAGAGADQKAEVKPSMNDWLRGTRPS